MTSDRVGTSLCGFCFAANGARVPHRRGVLMPGCICDCHDKKDDD